jgi:hypothetical protein
LGAKWQVGYRTITIGLANMGWLRRLRRVCVLREVRILLTRLAPDTVERLFANEESERLLAAYLRAKVVGSQHSNDAQHVAIATVARADVILSWNFKHIVHWDRIRLFNAVNLREGYPIAEIRSPKEFV